MKILSYIQLLKKYNTLKNNYDTLQKTHEDDVKDKTYMYHEIKQLKQKLRDIKKKKKKK